MEQEDFKKQAFQDFAKQHSYDLEYANLEFKMLEKNDLKPEEVRLSKTVDFAFFSLGCRIWASSLQSDSWTKMREQIGAVMNRLDHTIANLQQVATNLATAKGRIVDADFAAETSNLARTQVLQQASMAATWLKKMAWTNSLNR